jgi:hypothetical protein
MRIHELIGEIGSKLQHQGVLGHLLIRERKREKGFTSSAFGQDTFIVHPKDEQRRVRKLSNDASKKKLQIPKKREPAVPGRAAAGGITGVAAWATPLGFGGVQGCHGSAAQRRVPRAMKNGRQQERRVASQIRAVEGGAAMRRRRGQSCGMGASAARRRPAARGDLGEGEGPAGDVQQRGLAGGRAAFRGAGLGAAEV